MPSSPLKKVFVVWDFTNKKIALTLEQLERKPPEGFEIKVPRPRGVQGEIRRDIVEPGIRAADIVVALVDQPNANVGFEIGMALGLGKQVKLCRAGSALPAWTQRPPLKNHVLDSSPTLSALRELIASADSVPRVARPERGDGTLYLCPDEGDGEAVDECVREAAPSWKRLKPTGWTVKDLSTQMRGAGRVVWLILDFDETASERDGPANAALAVVAGFAEMCELELLSWHNELHEREIADVGHRARPWRDLEGLGKLIAEIEAPVPRSTDILDAYRAWLCDVHKVLPYLPELIDKEVGHVYVPLRAERRHDKARAHADLERLAKHSASTARQLLELPTDDALVSSGRWILVGEPGAGKSTVCRHLCFTLAQEAGRALPVFASLARFVASKDDLFTLVGRDLDEGRDEKRSLALAERLRELATSTDDVWIVLDGLDEVREQDRDRVRKRFDDLVKAYPRCRVLVTTRLQGYRELGHGFQRADLQPLSVPARKELLAKWIPTIAGDIWERIVGLPTLEALSSNPLMLTLMAMQAAADKSLPPTRAELFERSIELLLQHGTDRTKCPVRDLETAKLLLPAFALALHEHGAEAWDLAELNRVLWSVRKRDEDFSRKLKDTWESNQAFLDEICRASGLFVPYPGAQAQWRFFHRALREYLSAQALAAAGEKTYSKRVKALARDPQSVDHWGETVAMLCSALRTPAKRLELLRLVRDVEAPAKRRGRSLEIGDAGQSAGVDLALRALPHVEGVAAQDSLAFLMETSGWDGDHLAQLVRGWLVQHSDRGELRKLVMAQVAGFAKDTERLAFLYYGLEVGGLGVEREAFFRSCKRWPKAGPPTIDTVAIPPSGEITTFAMGSPEGEGHENEHPPHDVTLTPFRLGRTTVTVEQFALFERRRADRANPRKPIVGVSWWQAWLFCRWVGGRLPTEAQWEFACRAGETTPWSVRRERLGDVAWFGENSGGELHDVATRKPNGWGLFDMHGNVWEWCWDVFASYHDELNPDPAGPGGAGWRVVRGGACWDVADGCRSAYRISDHPGDRWDFLGFRVAFPGAPQLGGASTLDP